MKRHLKLNQAVFDKSNIYEFFFQNILLCTALQTRVSKSFCPFAYAHPIVYNHFFAKSELEKAKQFDYLFLAIK
jgi:hypothetical protein